VFRFSWRPSASARLAAVGLAWAGCSSGSVDAAGERRIQADEGRYETAFREVGALVPEQSDSLPIVRVSGVAFNGAGELLLADASEGTVKLFDAMGTLRRMLGRKGEGPGEFMQPRFPRFGPDGRIYVADSQLPRVTVFDSSGALIRSVSIPGLVSFMGFSVLPDGRFLFTAHRPEAPTDEVLFLTDSLGGLERSMLPIRNVIPAGHADHELWRSIRRMPHAVYGDTAVVVAGLVPTVWLVDLRTGAVTAERLGIPGYVEPHPPAERPTSIPELESWANSFHLAAPPVVVGRQIAVPFVQGILNYGDPMILLLRSAGGEWRAVTGAPPVIGSRGDDFVVLADPSADSVAFRFIRSRQ
jgi:hypothetical protein